MLFQPILALDIMNFFKLAKLLGGGKTICLPPNIFIGGGDCPPAPPPPGSTPLLRWPGGGCGRGGGGSHGRELFNFST